MSELATLARPYAAAAFKRAKQTAATEKWSLSLSFLADQLKDKNFLFVANNPKVSNEILTALILEISRDRLDSEAVNFVKLLIENKRLLLLTHIAKLFESLKAEDEGYIHVDVTVAYPFTKESKQDFTAKLEKKLGKKVHLKVTADKKLIGGVLVRAGDKVIDGSVRGRLQNMQKALQ